MSFLQKKLWIAWSKLRFLRLPPERRVRLEVTTDGRHLTFILVSLYEAGYGVQVFGGDWFFRELMLLRKTAPIPFLYGGEERECGISISDKSGFNHGGHGGHRDEKRILLDYDFFSGLNKGVASHGGTANTEVGEDLGKNESRENFNHTLAAGRPLGRLPQGSPKGEMSGSERVKLHEYARIEAEQAGLRLAGQADAEFSNPFTIELAQDSENTSPTRSANGPAEEALRAEMQRSGNIEPHPGGWAAARESRLLGGTEKDCRKAAPKEEQGGNLVNQTAARQPEGQDERERTSQITRIYTDGQQGEAQGTCAGDAFSNPSTSELARASGNTSLTRSASVPAGAFFADNVEIESAGGSQLADSMEFLEGQSQAGLQMHNQKGPTIRTANDPSADWDYSSSVLIRDICGQKSGNIDFPPQALRAPYFMHPSVYHRGLNKRRSPSTALAPRHSAEGASHPLPVTSYPPQRRRRFRIGFFGTHDRDFYTKHYHFPGMNRFEILEVFLQKFGDRMTPLRGFPRDWDSCQMAVSIDARGGDRKGKTFLSQEHYFEALRECDFVLSPPGWCMPLSHNLIEAMFCGAIPITNAGAFMVEPLMNGETCLKFEDAEDFVSVIERALAMDEREVGRMRSSVRNYYERFLDPKAFAEELRRSDCRRVFVNAEENSVPFVFPGKK